VSRICDIENLLLSAANGLTSELTDDDIKRLEFWRFISNEKVAVDGIPRHISHIRSSGKSEHEQKEEEQL